MAKEARSRVRKWAPLICGVMLIGVVALTCLKSNTSSKSTRVLFSSLLDTEWFKPTSKGTHTHTHTQTRTHTHTHTHKHTRYTVHTGPNIHTHTHTHTRHNITNHTHLRSWNNLKCKFHKIQTCFLASRVGRSTSILFSNLRSMAWSNSQGKLEAANRNTRSLDLASPSICTSSSVKRLVRQIWLLMQ